MTTNDLPPDLQQHVDALPTDQRPRRDLWPAIEAALDAEFRPPDSVPVAPKTSWVRRWGAACAIAAVSSAFTLAYTHQAPQDPGPVVDLIVADWERGLRQNNAELSAVLDARSREMDPALLAVVRDNLVTIDQAIETVRDALREDPDNAELSDDLTYVYLRKRDLLRQASNYGS